MKNLLLLLITFLLALPVKAEEFSSTSGAPALNAVAPSLPEPAGVPGKTGRPYAKVAAPAKESSLIQALELPPSEFFVMEEPEAANGDFELSFPEDVLPESDIPLTLNAKVEYFIGYFQTRAKNVFARWLSRSERYIPMMKEVLKKEGMPEDLVYLAMIESGFYPHAYSVASAVGPWQFMSATGKRYALRIDPWIDERRDPLKSTIAAAMYLKELYDLFNKDWYLAAAGYNAGENKILRAIDMYNSRDFWQLSKGSYLKRETRDYVPKLLAAAIIAKEPAKYGFADVAYLPPVEFDTVVIPSRTDLELVAKICEVPCQTIRDLNPELRRWCTPPGYLNYELKLPKGKKALFEAEYAKIPEERRFTEKIVYAKYRAGKKDTLTSVARRFGTTPQLLAELNHLGKGKKLRGKVLLVPVQTASSGDGSEAKPVRAAKGKADNKEFNKYYTVKRGDTLHSLAKRFNVSARILSAWNNLKGKVALRPGRRIIVAKYVEKKGAMVPVSDNG
ncbi:MAG: membrane-bound lytic murein transglycosylase [Geobacteraceae bacterium]|nr:MAG: membrane-bound lytic murein transglycosylase [Geobacteraceae bacterium]